VNATFLLMSSVLVPGADTPPAVAVPAPAPAAVAPAWPAAGFPAPAFPAPGFNCAPGIAPGCGDPYPFEERRGLFGRRKGGDCDCGTTKARRGLFHGFTTSACDDGRGGLFSRLHSRMGRGHGDCCDVGWGCAAPAWGGIPAVGGCGLPPVPGAVAPAVPGVVAPAAPGVAPVPMEKPKDPPKTNGAGTAGLNTPAPLPVPPIPVLAGAKSPF
jgi:hypothetical protein